MGQARQCYNPKIFLPENNPLLSLSQWHLLQLYLMDAINLPLSSEAMPLPEVLEVYKNLHAEAVAFQGDALFQAQTLGNQLYSYSQTASRTFMSLVLLMDEPVPDQTAILDRLDNLQARATAYQRSANDLFQESQRFVAVTQQAAIDLSAAIAQEIRQIDLDQLQIQRLQGEYEAKYRDIQQAQAQIVSDRNTIDETKYYSWIPGIGTGVAIGKIIDKENDIKFQISRINADTQTMQDIQNQIQEFNAEIAHLTYARQFNQQMVERTQSLTVELQKIESAWKTIASELGDVANNVKLAGATDLKRNFCLAAVQLTTAANEWMDVERDAENFTSNFYLQPA